MAADEAKKRVRDIPNIVNAHSSEEKSLGMKGDRAAADLPKEFPNKSEVTKRSVTGASDKEIDIEVIQGREMTDAEIESVAHLLFRWWRSEFEESESERKL